MNVVTPQPDPNGNLTLGFWEVETCSLRDFPQQSVIAQTGTGT